MLVIVLFKFINVMILCRAHRHRAAQLHRGSNAYVQLALLVKVVVVHTMRSYIRRKFVIKNASADTQREIAILKELNEHPKHSRFDCVAGNSL